MEIEKLSQLAHELGFDGVGVSDIDLSEASERFQQWIKHQYHGTMDFLTKHGEKRWKPELLVPGTIRAITVRINYLTSDPKFQETLHNPSLAYVSRYAQNDDYHTLIRKKLQKLAERLSEEIGPHSYRVFSDSAPVLEKPLAEKAGLGWTGKHTNLIDSKSGSYFFLGVIYTDYPFPISHSTTRSHCGTCTRCIQVCPTQAIVEPYVLDARRCIAYLTIELKGPIPLEFRKAIGNRIYGCDDCQIVCPWNKFAQTSREIRFHASAKRGLLEPELLELFQWSEKDFLKRTEGSPIRRIGYEKWLGNIAVALGNSSKIGPQVEPIKTALKEKIHFPSEAVQEQVKWALTQFDKV
jgi:epoxyqueuosine reductase